MSAYNYIHGKQTQWALNQGIPLIGSKGPKGMPAYTTVLDHNLFEPLAPDVSACFVQGDGNEINVCPDDTTNKYLHAAQLIKHILGLKIKTGKSGFRLLYLWYDVFGTQGAVHRKEIECFSTIAKADGCESRRGEIPCAVVPGVNPDTVQKAQVGAWELYQVPD